MAVELRSPSTVRTLLDHGIRNGLCHMGLLLAMELNALHLVTLIMQKGVQGKPLIEPFAVPLVFYAASVGYVDVVRGFLDKGLNVDIRWKEGMLHSGITPFISYSESDTLLGLAMRGNDSEVVDVLLQHGAELSLQDGPVLLLQAARGRHFEFVKYLLRKGVAAEPQDSTLGHLLHESIQPCKRISMNIMSILLDYGASPNARDKLGSSVLAKVAARGYPAIIRLLLWYGAHADPVDCLGRTPLFMAVMACRLDVVEILLETGDVNIRPRTCAGRTLVSVASGANSLEILQALKNWEDGVHPEKNEAATAAAISLRIDEIFGNRDSLTPRCCNTCDQPLPDAEPYLVCWICESLYLEYWMNRRLEMCLECVVGGIGCYDKLHTLEKVVCIDGEETTIEKMARLRQTALPVRIPTKESQLI
ncbi:ankyrin repeat-containing domain protein [Aspergillus insuetus]